ncbi:MAG: PAS domain S-box protein [Leptothrix sp. (in: b-proteobacteria)]
MTKPAGSTNTTAWSSPVLALLDAAPVGLMLVAADGHIQHVNAHLAHQFGWSAEELVGRPVEALLPQRLRTGHPARRDAYLAAPETLSMGKTRELLACRKDGSEFPVEVGLHPLPDTPDRQVLVSVLDRSEQLHAQAAQARLGAIVESSADAIVSKDLAGHVTSWNQAAEELFGFSAREAIGRQITELMIPPSRHQEEHDVMVRVCDGARVRELETLRRCKDGRILDVRVTVSPLHDARGQVIGASSIMRDISAYKQAAALRRAAEMSGLRLRALVDGLPQFVWYADQNGRLSIEGLLGAAQDEECSSGMLDLPRHDAALIDEARQALDTQQTRDGELHHGERIYLRRITPLHTAPQNDLHMLSGVVLAYVDITELRRREKQLAERDQFVSRLANQLPGLVGYWDKDLHCRFANRTYMDWFGMDPAAMLGKHSREVLGDELFARNEPFMRKALGGEPQHFERTIVRPDGCTMHTLAHFIPDIIDGEVHGYFVQATDVNELREREQELERLKATLEGMVEDRTAELVASEQRFRLLAHSLPQLIWTCTPQGSCDFLSDQWGRYTGLDPASQLGAVWLEQVHPDDRERLVQIWTRCVETGQDLQAEFRLRRHDGTYRWFDTRALPLRDEAGRILKWFGSNTDIEERRVMEAQLRRHSQELQRSNTALEQYAYASSHDLQEPLRMVTSYTQLIERRYATVLDDPGRQMMSYVIDSAKRMQALVNDLLAYARAGAPQAESACTDMNAVCTKALRLLDGAIQREQAEISVEADLPAVRAEAVPMLQLLQNLIGNALRYRSTVAPRIQVGVRERSAQEAMFFVKDNGMGIDPQHHARIFLLFQRLETDPARRRDSTGIGLALCKRVVEAVGGRLWVESEAECGSTFYFTLPLAGSDH